MSYQRAEQGRKAGKAPLLHNMAELYLQSKLGSFLLLASYSRIAHVSLENIVGREWNNFLKIKYSKFPIISDPRKLLEVNKSPCFNANILQAHSVLLLPPSPPMSYYCVLFPEPTFIKYMTYKTIQDGGGCPWWWCYITERFVVYFWDP